MVEAGNGGLGEPESPPKADLQSIAGGLDILEMGLLAIFTELLKPISSSLEQLNATLQKVTDVVEVARDLGTKPNRRLLNN